MSTEVEPEAYEQFRQYAQENWDSLELIDGGGDTVHSISLSEGDWEEDGDIIKVEETVTGTDVGVGETVAGSRVYDSGAGNVMHVDTDPSDFTFENEGDELQITHEIEIPQS